ncbi:MAG: fumarylacetoacetate hydrolase family protein [Candidatus Marinimicrobia bacterium]|nr:fumarylacetoacetate hydrolase family protein [Candidatus Neomarinimicrobiota bacterium]MBT3496953.1 fumarylacetoacetate hydrolase family protein [Candidatus Neomarinimicrobiota bacterium]MBT3692141.1 fumarylacetoacetate hydrolase family protein [Candidatus Neomarinimicrobiota bacterium]MBT3732965.1 fumarylacetoacetate hydrolase family protein [Candidatus Neomarinimicrobiota bacterium]MBT4143865.1 fumarylacetoacetate hydrolase family protein [Candidatus Neomarinimicrobiota bacterium]
MKFVTYTHIEGTEPRFGFVRDDYIVDVLYGAIYINESQGNSTFLSIPTSLKRALENWTEIFEQLKDLERSLPDSLIHTYSARGKPIAQAIDSVQFFPPVPEPRTFRDFYAFEQHVKSARKNRGLEIDPLWYEIPIFYFSNPTALYGHKDEIPYPEPSEELDFELEFAVIIAEGGRDISEKDAGNFIGGYTICNDWSARDFQREEMRLSLGPAKGKDFATSFGPFMVTPDELDNHLDEDGKLNLRMTCKVNGELLSDGNSNDLYHSFASMIERASQNANLHAGDYIGSGTVGTGCILELGPENTNGWLKKGDLLTLEIEGLGTLENKIV